MPMFSMAFMELLIAHIQACPTSNVFILHV